MKTIQWQSDFISHGPMTVVEKADFWPYWVPLSLLISCLLIVAIRFIHPGYYRVLFEASFRNINIDLYVREDLSNSAFSGTLLHFNFVFISAVIILVGFTGGTLSSEIPIKPLSFIFLFLAAHLVYRYVMLWIVKSLSQVDRGLMESVYNYKVSVELGGILLTILMVAHFTVKFDGELFMILFGSLYLIINVLYWFWSFSHALRNGLPWFYLFLYLCTLEILPLVVVYLVFNDKI